MGKEGLLEIKSIDQGSIDPMGHEKWFSEHLQLFTNNDELKLGNG